MCMAFAFIVEEKQQGRSGRYCKNFYLQDFFAVILFPKVLNLTFTNVLKCTCIFQCQVSVLLDMLKMCTKQNVSCKK